MNTVQSTSSNEKDYESIAGYRFSWWKSTIFYVVAVLTAGLTYLFSMWFPYFYTIFRKSKVPFAKADSVLIQGLDGGWEEVPILKLPNWIDDRNNYGSFQNTPTELHFFLYRNIRYIYSPRIDAFFRPEFNSALSFNTMFDMSNGLVEEDRQKRFLLYGQNMINIPIKSIPKMIFEEVGHPFYLFQLFSCAVWFSDGYFYYAGTIVFLSLLSIAWSVYFTRSNLVKLVELVRDECSVNLFISRTTETQQVETKSPELVPGDVIQIFPDMNIPCDLLLLSGQCVMNESMLTGESNPVIKSSITRGEVIYNSSTHKRHTLFSGTRVLQLSTQHPNSIVKGLVVKTGFTTAKGQLFHSILFPKPIQFDIDKDSMIFLGGMIVVAIICCIYSAITIYKYGFGIKPIILKSLDIITVTVAPALPVILTISTSLALSRLRNQRIFCTSPARINLAGKINKACFDKTGTLTEDYLTIKAVLPASSSSFEEEEPYLSKLRGPVQEVLTTTHNLAQVEGELVGHPVDVQMFQATTWSLYRPDELTLFETASTTLSENALAYVGDQNRGLLRILRRFEFDPSLQRMSVIVQNIPSTLFHTGKGYSFVEDGDNDRDAHFRVCVKGSPEVIRSLSLDHTVPRNFEEVLRQYSKEGYYVLGLAEKEIIGIEDDWLFSVERNSIETHLNFVGLLVLENKLKPESASVIAQLQAADIDTIMITGDNLYTGVCVAKKCLMIPQASQVYVATDVGEGKIEWENLDNTDGNKQVIVEKRGYPSRVVDPTELVEQDGCALAVPGVLVQPLLSSYNATILEKVKVFGRTTPDQKTAIIEYLINRGHSPSMCGDGTNDCGALKAAHVGLALSDAEASIVSPFSSARKTIADVPHLIQEGRCALTSCIEAFKYMVIYPVLQLSTVLRLYNAYSILGDFQYLYIDLFVVLPIATFMCNTRASTTLAKRTPSSTMWTLPTLISLFYEIVLNVSLMAIVNLILKGQSWFSPHDKGDDLLPECAENSTTFLFVNFQYVITALAFSPGNPFRKPFYTNIWFMVSILIVWGFNSFLLLADFDHKGDHWIESLFQLVTLPSHWRLELFALVWLNLFLSQAFQRLFIWGDTGTWFYNQYLTLKKHIILKMRAPPSEEYISII